MRKRRLVRKMRRGEEDTRIRGEEERRRKGEGENRRTG